MADLLRKMGRNSEAIRCYEVAARRGSASACNWLHVMYRNGLGAPSDLIKSRAFLEKSSSLGHLYANRDIAKSGIRGERGFFGCLNGPWVLFFGAFSLFTALRNETQDDDIYC